MVKLEPHTCSTYNGVIIYMYMLVYTIKKLVASMETSGDRDIDMEWYGSDRLQPGRAILYSERNEMSTCARALAAAAGMASPISSQLLLSISTSKHWLIQLLPCPLALVPNVWSTGHLHPIIHRLPSCPERRDEQKGLLFVVKKKQLLNHRSAVQSFN
jgi:hypothetical protein